MQIWSEPWNEEEPLAVEASQGSSPTNPNNGKYQSFSYNV